MRFNFLRSSLSGDFELGRVLLACGSAAAITTPIGFQIADMWLNKAHFDVAAWCTAYPAGLAALNALGVFTIGKKERDVAAANALQAATQGPQP